MQQKTKLKLISLLISSTALVSGCAGGSSGESNTNNNTQTVKNPNNHLLNNNPGSSTSNTSGSSTSNTSGSSTLILDNNDHNTDNDSEILEKIIISDYQNKGKLKADLIPEIGDNISWSTNSPDLISIDPTTGVITPYKTGTAIINTTNLDNGEIITKEIHIKALNITSSPERIKFGFNSNKLMATNGKNQYISVDTSEFIEIDNNGVSKKVNINDVSFMKVPSSNTPDRSTKYTLSIKGITYDNGIYALLGLQEKTNIFIIDDNEKDKEEEKKKITSLKISTVPVIIFLDEESLKDTSFQISDPKVIYYEKHNLRHDPSDKFAELKNIAPVKNQGKFLATDQNQNELAIFTKEKLEKRIQLWHHGTTYSNNSQIVYGNDYLIMYDNNKIAYYSLKSTYTTLNAIENINNYHIGSITYNEDTKKFILLATQPDNEAKYIISIDSNNSSGQLSLNEIHKYSDSNNTSTMII